MPNLALLFASQQGCHMLGLYHVSLSAGEMWLYPIQVVASTATLPLQTMLQLHFFMAIFNVKLSTPDLLFL
jgi:hypothetical protein